jgi:hypothetical protein
MLRVMMTKGMVANHSVKLNQWLAKNNQAATALWLLAIPYLSSIFATVTDCKIICHFSGAPCPGGFSDIVNATFKLIAGIANSDTKATTL